MRVAIFALHTLALLASALACSAPSTAAPCATPEHRQFDFWVGEWQVRTPEGKVAGTNRIEREYDGCVVHERYTTKRGYAGESLNTYDATRNVWHQTWVDNEGTLLQLEGALRDGRMILEGQTIGKDGIITKHRISWTPEDDGTVRQLWESTDAKGAWRTLFDGRYTRIEREIP